MIPLKGTASIIQDLEVYSFPLFSVDILRFR